MIRRMHTMKQGLLLFAFTLSCIHIQAQEESMLRYPEQLSKADTGSNKYPFLKQHTIALQAFRELLDSCRYVGLEKTKYHYEELYEHSSTTVAQQRHWLADGLLSYFIDLRIGADIGDMLGYDGLSPTCRERDKAEVIAALSLARSAADIQRIVAGYEPDSREYQALKQELAVAIKRGDKTGERQLANSLNLYRWMLHFHFNRFILVNIASAQLKYYSADTPLLEMKVVAGKPSTPTPRFAAYLNEVIFYPYWHVPNSIAVNEILPQCRKNPVILDAFNIQVLNKNGEVVDLSDVPWATLNKKNFPYMLRQGTGCDNALGVIKFNLTSPFSVYLHDTNLKSAFKSSSRYFSHGCMRIEKPETLAQLLVPGKVDSNFLRACVHGQKSVVETVRDAVPIFVLYMTADVSGTSVSYYPDIYNLGL